MAIEDYRRLAQLDGKTLFGTYAHRVKRDRLGKVVPAKESWRQRWIAFRSGYRASSRFNQEEIFRFYRALEDEYGMDIAQRLSQKYLNSRFDRGGNLSSRTIRRALSDADRLRLRETRRIRETAGIGSSKEFREILVEYGKTAESLSPQEGERLRSAIRSALRSDARYGTPALDDNAVLVIQRRVIQGFLNERDKAKCFKQHAVLPSMHYNHELENYTTEALICEEWRVKLDDPDWAPRVSKVASLAQECAVFLRWEASNNLELERLQAGLEVMLANIEKASEELLRQEAPSKYELGELPAGLNELPTTIKKASEELKSEPVAPDGRVQQTLAAMRDAVKARIEQIKTYDVAFGTDKRLAPVIDQEYEAFKILFTEIVAPGDANTAEKAQLRQTAISIEDGPERHVASFLDKIESDRQNDQASAHAMWVGSPREGIPAAQAKEFMRQIRARLLNSARDTLRRCGLPTKDLAKRLEQARLLALSRNPKWDTFSSETRYRDDLGRGQRVYSKLTPAFQLNSLKEYYHPDERGVSSGAYGKTDHATNLWVDRLVSSRDQPICSVVRSGAHNSNQGAEEMFLAVCEGNADEIIRQATAGPAWSVEVPFVDMGLLSTTVFASENGHRSRHLSAIRSLRGKKFTVSLKNSDGYTREVVVVPRPLDFNLGMRDCDFGFVGQLTSDVDQDERNRKNLEALVGSLDPNHKPGGLAGDFLESNPGINPAQRRAIIELVDQTRELYVSRAYRWDDEDQYKFAARVCLLAQMINVMPCIHCKSGKDRTSRLIEEIKLLACETRDSGVVPAPGPRSPTQQERTVAFALSCGNERIQELNTGYQGNKQHKALDRLVKQKSIPLQKQMEHYRGWEKIAKS